MRWINVRLADGGNGQLLVGPEGELDHSEPWATLRLPSGHSLLVPTEALEPEGEGYHLPISLSQLGLELRTTPESTIIPIIEEELEVAVHDVEVASITVRTRLESETTLVEETLRREQVEVERVAIDREVSGPQPVRYEEDLVIIPVVEEVLVLQKRYVLKEEVRVRTRRVDVPERREVVLRRQVAEVQRQEHPAVE